MKRPPPLPEALVKQLGQGRSVLATWLDDSIPWVVITRKDKEPG